MNQEAYNKFTEAQHEYLLANGWTVNTSGGWSKNGRRKKYDFGHAVNSQLMEDRGSVNIRPGETLTDEQIEASRKLYGPWTDEEQVLRAKQEIRRLWDRRHTPKAPGISSVRGEIRSWVRWVAKHKEPNTRVEHARKARAEHARHHKTKGCSCGKEGAPW